MASVASEQPPILARVERLDLMLFYLEEMRGSRRATAVRSPSASTTSSGTATTSDGGASSVNSSPKTITRRRCRPIKDVVMEVEVKGSLIDRVDHLEGRLLKLEEEIKQEKKSTEEEEGRSPRSGEKRAHSKGLKRLVKSCVKVKTRD